MRILVIGRQDIAKAEDIISALKRLGHEAEFLLFPGFHYVTRESVFTTSSGEIRSPYACSVYGYYFKYFFSASFLLRKMFRKKQYDIILAIDWLEGTIALYYKWLFARHSKVIFYSYDAYFFDSKFSSRYLINRIDRFVAKHVDEVWNVNENIGLERAKRGVKVKTEQTLPLGIEQKLGLWTPKQPKQFLFVGSFKKGHNLKKLVKVFSELHRKDPVFKLTLVGKGNQEAAIREAIQIQGAEDVVCLRGFVSEQELLNEIQSGMYVAGVAVYEATQAITCADPGKIKDYLSWGLPVLTTAVSALTEDVRKYDLGWVVDSDDPKNLMEAFSLVGISSVEKKQRNIAEYVRNHSFDMMLRKGLRKYT